VRKVSDVKKKWSQPTTIVVSVKMTADKSGLETDAATGGSAQERVFVMNSYNKGLTAGG